jgi:peptidoglycan/LPS O-acetylase OafA/YrhL
MRPPTRHLQLLTMSRGIAALWVLAHNDQLFRIETDVDSFTGLFAKGYLAVDFFLVLSGFILTYTHGPSFTDSTVRTNLNGFRSTFNDFIVARLARIYPLYIVLLGVRVAIELVKYLAGVPASEYGPAPFQGGNSLSALLANALMIQAWGFYEGLTWVPSFWTVSAEWFAYLLFPVVLWCFGKYFRFRLVALLLAVGLLAILVVGIHLNGNLEFTMQFSLLRCLPEFGLGILLGLHFEKWRGRFSTLAMSGMLTASLLGGLIAAHFRLHDILFVLLTCGAIPLAALSSFALEDSRPRNTGDNALFSGVLRVLQYLGEISYAVYLLHLIVQSAYRLLESRLISDPTPAVALGALVFKLTVILAGAVVLHHFVETPARKYIRGLRSSS